jgi:hypothetical protein
VPIPALTGEPAEAAAKEMNFDQAFAAIQEQSEDYARLLSDWTDADFRARSKCSATRPRGAL